MKIKMDNTHKNSDDILEADFRERSLTSKTYAKRYQLVEE